MTADRPQVINLVNHPCQAAMTRRRFLTTSGGVLAAGVLLARHRLPTAYAETGAAVGTVATSPWPMYGHDSAHTGRSTAAGPSTPRLAWSYPLGVHVGDNASPVVGADGTIYMPSSTSFFAIRPNGTLRWRKWGTSPFDAADIRLTPAVAADGSVYVTAQAVLDDPRWPSHLLYALRPTDGQTLWSYNIGRVTYGSPTVASSDGTIYLASATSPGVLDAIRPNGTRKWRWRSLSSGWIESSPAIGPSGDIYVQHNTLGLVALTSSGRLKWRRSMGSGGGGLGEAFNSPAIGGGIIYIGSSDQYFYAVNPDGSERWKVAVEHWMHQAAAAISADGTIYRGDNGGIFYAFDRAGFVKWRYNTGIPGAILCTPALAANDMIFFTQDWSSDVGPTDKGSLYAVRASTGVLLWKEEIGWSSSSPVITADGTLYACGDRDVATGKAVLYAFRSA